jgi:hypothetical protein
MPTSVAELEETMTNPKPPPAKNLHNLHNFNLLLKIETFTKEQACFRLRSCIQIVLIYQILLQNKGRDCQYKKINK